MEIKFGKHEFYFGRKPKEPKQQTSVVYISDNYRYGSVNNIISKEMSQVWLRNFANTPICRRAINLLKNSVLNLEWKVEKRDIADKNDYSETISVIENCLRQPNYKDTFRTLLGSTIDDILTGDCGAIEIRESSDSLRPIWLYPVDGFSIQINANYITSPKDIAFLQRKSDGTELKLADEELMYLKMNNFSYTPLGLAPVESAFCIINYLLEVQKYAGTAASNAIPKYALNLGENIDEIQLNRFRKYFDEQITGSGRTPIVGGSKGIESVQLAAGDDNGLYLAWQHFLISIIAYSFGIDPKRFNEGSSTDRSTVSEQKENTISEAIKPLADMIAEQINKKVVSRLGYGDKLIFRFLYEDSEDRKKAKSDRVLAEYNADLLTLDEARQLLGYQKSENEYGDMLKSEYKTALNTKYALETQNTGGFNGVGKNRYDGGDNPE